MESPGGMPEPMQPLFYPHVFPVYPGSPRGTVRGIPAQQQGQQNINNYRLMQRSYDDADILRHADHSVLIHNTDQASGPPMPGVPASRGGTLPRLKGLSVGQRPVARVAANTRNECMEGNLSQMQDLDNIDICDNQSDSSSAGMGRGAGPGGCKPVPSQSESSSMLQQLCKSGTSSPNMTLQRRSARSGSDAGLQQLKRNSSF